MAHSHHQPLLGPCCLGHWRCWQGQLAQAPADSEAPSPHCRRSCILVPPSVPTRPMRISRCNLGVKPMIAWAKSVAGVPMLRKPSRASLRRQRRCARQRSACRSSPRRHAMKGLRATPIKLTLSALGLAVLTGCPVSAWIRTWVELTPNGKLHQRQTRLGPHPGGARPACAGRSSLAGAAPGSGRCRPVDLGEQPIPAGPAGARLGECGRCCPGRADCQPHFSVLSA